MNLEDVRKIAREKMNLHGLTDWNWNLKFKNSKSYAGLCQKKFWHEDPIRSTGIITLSIDFMEVFDEKEALETILHEIAHALTSPSHRPHGKEWKAKARSIGSTGSRCVPKEAPRPKALYTGVCKNGHKIHANRLTEKAKNNKSCGQCSPYFSRDFRFDWYKGDVLVYAQLRFTEPVAQKVVYEKPTPLYSGLERHMDSSAEDVSEQLRLVREILKG